MEKKELVIKVSKKIKANKKINDLFRALYQVLGNKIYLRELEVALKKKDFELPPEVSGLLDYLIRDLHHLKDK